MRNAFADEITNIAKSDPRVVLLSGDIGNRLFDKLKTQSNGKQFINCGIAESNMMSVAAGLGLAGSKPVVYTITPFTTTRCLEQIKIGLAYHSSPVLIVGTGSGLSYASLGPTHHSLEDFAIIQSIPNMTILAPWDQSSVRKIVREAIQLGSPCYVRIGKKGEPDICSIDETPKIGELYRLKEGEEICVLSVGTMAIEAIKAQKALERDNIRIGIALCHTVKPFPEQAIEKLCVSYKKIFVIEEHSFIGGFGSSLVNFVNKRSIKTKIYSYGTSDNFLSTIGSQEFARKEFQIDSESIVTNIKNV
jgi:transketolase